MRGLGHHTFCRYTVYLNYRWRHLNYLNDNDNCHMDKEYERLRGR